MGTAALLGVRPGQVARPRCFDFRPTSWCKKFWPSTDCLRGRSARAGPKCQNQYRRPKTGRLSAPRSSRTSPITSTMIPIVTRIEMFNNHPRISRIRPRTTIALPPDRHTCKRPPALISNVDPQSPEGARSAKVGGARRFEPLTSSMPSGRGRQLPPSRSDRTVSGRTSLSVQCWLCCHPNCHPHVDLSFCPNDRSPARPLRKRDTSTAPSAAAVRAGEPADPRCRPPGSPGLGFVRSGAGAR
jgi:hypothetical protein